MSHEMYLKAWIEKFKPDMQEDGITLRRYERQELRNVNPNFIWTEHSSLGEPIVPGMRFVDAFAYLVTKEPWTSWQRESLGMIVTDFQTRQDYLDMIAVFETDGDEDAVEEWTEAMNERFGEDD